MVPPKTILTTNRLLRHILYWFGLTSGFALVWGTYDNDYIRSFTIQIFALPARMLLVYTTLYVLVPAFLLKRKFSLFALSYMVLLVVITISIQRPIMLYYVQPTYISDWESFGYFNIIELMNTLLDINHAIIIPLVIVFVKFFYQEKSKALVLEKDQFKTELTQLRNQMHPHFLFNTLNSLYGLILKKSDDAEGAVLKLSGLMRYMIYEANVPKVPLSKEIAYLKNYVDLERLRFDPKANISFNSLTDKEYEISPFVLIPFIENAFKHSPNSKNCHITIQILAQDKELNLSIINEKSDKKKKGCPTTSGIGLSNVKKRLDLLYNQCHTLLFNETEDTFKVNLKLTLI